MPQPFPAYEKELEEFIEITPAMARREFSWLCRKDYYDKYESVRECIVCGENSNLPHKKEDFKGRGKELESFSRSNNERVIQKGVKEVQKEKREVLNVAC